MDEPLDIALYPRYVRLTLSGRWDMPRLTAALLQVQRDERVLARAQRLWDVRNAVMALTNEEMQQLATQLVMQVGAGVPRRTALVVGAAVMYGLGRMFQTRLELAQISTELQIFRELADAVAWLQADDASDSQPA